MSRGGLTSRPALPADYDHFVRLVPELAVADPVPERARWESVMAPHTLFFEDRGDVVAYAHYQVMNDTGYVRHVVVDPAHRGRRHGRAVMDELAALFRRAGCSRWELNVKPDNTPALRLYESVGMTAVYSSTALRFDWEIVERLPRDGRGVSGRTILPEEDAMVEAACKLPGGMLTTQRGTPGRALLALVDPAIGDGFFGVASFDVHFPGAFPFRVAEPMLARALLAAMRPHALPEHANVGVVVEDDAELTRLLVTHGAKVHLEIVHYTGPLPGEA
jgi:GNAT superfamily N-acetyltransferase